MAANHIIIGTTKPRATQLQRLVNMTREVMEMYDKEKAIMDTCVDVADYSVIESLYDLPAGKGEPVYTMLVNARAKLKDPATAKFVDWLG